MRFDTVEEAVKAIEGAEIRTGVERSALLVAANAKPRKRPPFKSQRFVTVLLESGNRAVSQVQTNYDGNPVFDFNEAHVDDSRWIYPELETVVLHGPDPATSISQAEWSKISGRIGVPRWEAELPRDTATKSEKG
jgi:hypothetical protein